MAAHTAGGASEQSATHTPALLAAGVILMVRDTAPRNAAFAGAVAIATGLKFYPIVAAGAFLVRRPAARAWRLAAASGLAATAALATASVDQTVKVWDAGDGSAQRLAAHAGRIAPSL